MRSSDTVALKWQAGVFLFTQNYDQDAVNTFAPFVLSPFLPFPVNQTRRKPRSTTSASASTGRATVTIQREARPHGGPARRSREQGREPQTRSRAGDRPADDSGRPNAASRTCRRSSPRPTAAARTSMRLRVGRQRIQGRRVQSRVAARQRGLRRRARLERRRRREDGVARTDAWPRRRRVLASTGAICS